MPAKPFDIKDYIKSLKLSDEEEKALTPILEKPERVEEIKRGWNSQSESSRLVDEANALKTASAAEKVEAERLHTEMLALDKKNKDWADALKKYEANTQATQAERDALVQEKALLATKSTAYEAYLKNIGVEPSFALEGVELPKPPAPKEPPPVNQPLAFDPKALEGYVTKEDYYKEVAPAVSLLSNLPFELTNLNFRHMELYGKPVPAAELQALQQQYLAPDNKRSLSDLAAERLHFDARQSELNEQAINERVKKEAEEMFTKRMSELNLPSAALDSLTPASMESAVHFASKGFAENGKGGGVVSDTSQVSEEEMQAFMQADQELAAKGIRPTPFN